MRGKRIIHAPRGKERSCKGWHQEAAMRMLMNNLDTDVAEDPDRLVVYGGTGRAARSWEAFDAIIRSLRELENDETLLVQSGKPVGKFHEQGLVIFEFAQGADDRIENDETLLVQSGKPVGKFRTHEEAPCVLIARARSR